MLIIIKAYISTNYNLGHLGVNRICIWRAELIYIYLCERIQTEWSFYTKGVILLFTVTWDCFPLFRDIVCKENSRVLQRLKDSVKQWWTSERRRLEVLITLRVQAIVIRHLVTIYMIKCIRACAIFCSHGIYHVVKHVSFVLASQISPTGWVVVHNSWPFFANEKV